MAEVKGLATRRVIGLSADGGFGCQLDIATFFAAAGIYVPD